MERRGAKIVGMRVMMMVVIVGMMTLGVEGGRNLKSNYNNNGKAASTATTAEEELGTPTYHPQNFFGGVGVLPFPTPGFGGIGSSGPGIGSRGSSSPPSVGSGSGSSIFCNFPGVNCPGFQPSSPHTGGAAGNIGAAKASPMP